MRLSVGFQEQSIILCQLFYTLCSGRISASLDPNKSDPSNNVGFVKSYLSNMLLTAFQHLNRLTCCSTL